MLILNSCKNTLPAKELTPEKIKNLFTEKFPLKQKGITPTGSVRIYLDGSLSMEGFVPGGNTQYCKALEAIGDYFITANMEYVKFGNFNFLENINSLRQARQSNFYNQSHTALAEVIEGFVNKDTLPRTIIIITDGVQSTPGSTYFDRIVRGIARWFERGGNFEILSIYSEFHGEAYSEREDRPLGQYNSDRYGKRPFYCYIFSLERGISENLKNALAGSGINSEMHNLDFSISPFSPCEIIKTDITTKSNICYKRFKEGIAYLNLTGDEKGIFEVKTKINLNKNSMFKPDSLLKTNHSFQSLDSSVFNKLEPQISYVDGTGRINVIRSNKFYISQYSVKKCEGTPDWVVRVMVLPDKGTIQPPDWVGMQSRDDDINRLIFSRSFKFKKFVQCIIDNSNLIKEPMGTFYLVLER